MTIVDSTDDGKPIPGGTSRGFLPRRSARLMGAALMGLGTAIWTLARPVAQQFQGSISTGPSQRIPNNLEYLSRVNEGIHGLNLVGHMLTEAVVHHPYVTGLPLVALGAVPVGHRAFEAMQRKTATPLMRHLRTYLSK
jgi:hypothetical protein